LKDATNLFFLLRRAVIVHVHVLDSLGLALAAGVDLLVLRCVEVSLLGWRVMGVVARCE
jgi:hypothetical protein